MSPSKKRKTSGLTILDYLNDDCWRCVLDYLDLKEVIISELVSRQWQAVVLRYMQTVRVALNDHEWSSPALTPWPRARWLELDEQDWPSFEHWTKKLGSRVVFAFCCSEYHLDVIRRNCPNVESLTVTRFEGEPISLNVNNRGFKHLRKLCFNNCCSITDRCVAQFINRNLTELEVLGDEEEFKMKGQFLNSVKSNLTSLSLSQMDLRWDRLQSIVGWLSELKKLHLTELPRSIFKNIHIVLDKTPKLEDLHLVSYHWLDVSGHVCRLAKLRRLSGNVLCTDEDLETVARGCQELQELELSTNTVTARGLRAMSRLAGARLRCLHLGHNSELTDDDLLACLGGCHKLAKVDVRGCEQMSSRLRLMPPTSPMWRFPSSNWTFH